MENNDQLNQFFQEMKKQDAQIEIPEFPVNEIKTRNLGLWIPVGIAASLALTFLFMKNPAPVAPISPEVVIITLQEDENQNQHFTIEESTFLDTWESPTAYLLTEY